MSRVVTFLLAILPYLAAGMLGARAVLRYGSQSAEEDAEPDREHFIQLKLNATDSEANTSAESTSKQQL